MIRVLHIVGGMDRAGAETMVMNLYRNIDRSKVQFDFLYFKSKDCDYDKEIIELGGKIHRVVARNPLLRFMKTFKFFKANAYKIVQAHTLFNIGFNLLVAKLAGIPMRIAHSHNTSASGSGIMVALYKSFSRLLIANFSTHFIACGEAAGKFLFSSKDFTVLPNSIDVDSFVKIGKEEKDYIEKQFNLNKTTLKLIQVGRLQKVKNHQFTLAICEELKKEKIDFHLYIVGQGILEEQIKDSLVIKNLQSNVSMLGVRNDVAQLMAGADIHIMPSHHEGFPVTLVEAQAIGLQSIISDNISKEVYLRLDIVNFLSLLDSHDLWYDKIVKVQKNIKKIENTLELLTDRGFDSKQNALKLQDLYLGK
jgi:glycosyltransferase EpsF